MYKKTVLENGLRVITVPLKNVQTVTVMVLVKAGAKDEESKEDGLSHFLEHMHFKGTKKRPTQSEVAEALDRVGGRFNAFTSSERTAYWVSTSSNHLDLALDWVSDIFLNSKIEEESIQKEKGVILEEINRDLDNPARNKWRSWLKLLYGNQPSGGSVLGEKDKILSFKRKDFVNYINNHYCVENTVVCVAGGFDEKSILDKIRKYFIGFSRTSPKKRARLIEDQDSAQARVDYKKTDQAHLCLGVRAYPLCHPEEYSQYLLGMIMGGMMSSRLWSLIRGKGLAYNIWTEAEAYTDTGFLVTGGGLDSKRIDLAIKIILKEMVRLKREKVGAPELKKVKENLKGKTILNLESSYNLASFYGDQELLENRIMTPEEYFKKVESVAAKDIQRVANDIFVPEKLNLALIGPFKDKKRFEKLLKI